MSTSMDVDSEYSLVLRFALLNDGLPYKGFDTDKLTISSSNDLQDLRNAIKAKCAGTLEGIDAGTLKIYATACTIEEATRHLNTMERGERVPLSDWKMTPLPKLALLSETFKEQPKTNSIHLIVDCTAARKFDNSRRLQQGEAKMDISADLPESEATYITPAPSLSKKLRRQAKARSELTVVPKKRKDETDLDYAYRIKETLGWTPRLGGEGGTYLSEQNAEFLRKKDLEGIDLRNESRFIDRHEKVDRLYQKLQEEIVVLIRSPPMSGKTSLAQLLERKAFKEQFEVYHGKLRVIRISLIWTRTSNMDWVFTEEFQWLMGGLSWEEFIEECNYIKTLLIIDEAQASLTYLYSPDGTPDNSYHGGEALWAKIKFAQQLGRPMIALFSTYGYRAAYRNNRQSVISPIRIQGSWSLEELRYTREEYDEVVQVLYQGTLAWWHLHSEISITISANFNEETSLVRNPFTFIEIFDYTKSNLFYLAIEADARAIQSLDKLTPDEQDFCDRVFRNPGQPPSDSHSEVAKQLSQIFILSENQTRGLDFSAPLLRYVYLRLRFGDIVRAKYSPDDFETFLRNVFHAMSPVVLQRTLGRGKNFDVLEITWQMKFYRAAMRILCKDDPISPNVGPIFGAKGYLDFWVGGTKKWCIEILRDGDRVKEHKARFKLRYKKIIEYSNEWAIIDIRRYGLPIPDGLPSEKIVFVECEEDFSAVKLTLPGSLYPETIPLSGEECN